MALCDADADTISSYNRSECSVVIDIELKNNKLA